MPDNVINAMKGLTQYLMTENQRLAVEREDKKINDAASQIAEAYKNLGPNASMEDIRKLQFASINAASNQGVIQEVMPLINQMQSSTLQTFAYNQTEKIRSNTEKFLEDRYGVQLPDGTDPVAISNLMYSRQEKEKVVDAGGQTWAVKYDDTGKEISKRLVDAIGTKDKLEQYDKQKGIDYKWDSRLLRDKAAITNAAGGSNGTGTGPSFAGFDPIMNYQGQNGEILYKSKKGRGMYALQPDGSLLFYNGHPQPTKGAIKDSMEMLGYKKTLDNTITEGLTKEIQVLLSTPAGQKTFKNLTGADLPVDMSTLKDADYKLYANLWENAATKNTWDTIKNKVGADLYQQEGAKGIWDLLSQTRQLPDQRKRANEMLFGTDEPPKKFGTLTQQEYNDANEMVMDVFSPQSTLDPTAKAAIVQWIMNKVEPQIGPTMMTQTGQGSYDDFRKLSEADKLQLLRIINEKTIK